MVLVMLLLFLFIFTLLTMGVLQTSLLEVQISNNYQKLRLLYLQADANLAVIEKQIIVGQPLPAGASKIADLSSGAVIYKIVSEAKNKEDRIEIATTYRVLDGYGRRYSWRLKKILLPDA